MTYCKAAGVSRYGTASTPAASITLQRDSDWPKAIQPVPVSGNNGFTQNDLPWCCLHYVNTAIQEHLH